MQPINYSAIGNFNNVFSAQIGKINQDSSMLMGGVETNIMPEMIKNDSELKNDLKILSNDGAGNVANNFKSALSNSMNELNATQRNAENAIETFATGGDIDVHSVMIASQKASMSLSMAMQLRNKAISAYQEIYKMGI